MTLGSTTPVLRIFDVDVAKSFYVDFLGFKVDWDHQLEDNFPLYMGISKDGCKLHLSEHHGDVCPGSSVRIEATDVDAYQSELTAKQYKYAKPGCEDMPWNSREMTVTDPFGNKLTFFQTKD